MAPRSILALLISILALLITVFRAVFDFVASLIQVISFSSDLAQKYLPQHSTVATFSFVVFTLWFCVLLTIMIAGLLIVLCMLESPIRDILN